MACRNLKNILDDFCNISGKLVNFLTSSIVFSKKFSTKCKIALASSVNMLPKSWLGCYLLGIFISSYQPTKADLNHIVQKYDKRINHWKSGFLSKGGRLTLIQSNLESLPAYSYASTMLLFDLANSIDTMHVKFFQVTK